MSRVVHVHEHLDHTNRTVERHNRLASLPNWATNCSTVVVGVVELHVVLAGPVRPATQRTQLAEYDKEATELSGYLERALDGG